MRVLFYASVCLSILCGPRAAWAEEKPGLAALNLNAQRGVEPDLAAMISDAALSVLRGSGRFKSVIGSSDVAAMISAEQQKQALGCDDDSCLAQLGGALGVPYLLTGSLGILGGRFMLNLKLLAVDEAKVAGRVTQMFDGERALGDGLKPTLDALLKDAFRAQTAASIRRKAAWLRGAGLTFGAFGAGLSVYSYSQVTRAQAAYNGAPSAASRCSLCSACWARDSAQLTSL